MRLRAVRCAEAAGGAPRLPRGKPPFPRLDSSRPHASRRLILSRPPARLSSAAESIVGQFLRTGYGGAAVQVNSKLCFVGLEQRAGVAEFVRDRVDRSLSRFGRDSMGLMQLYWCDQYHARMLSSWLSTSFFII